MATAQIAASFINGIARQHIWPQDTQLEGRSWLGMPNMRRAACRKAPMALLDMMRVCWREGSGRAGRIPTCAAQI